MKGTMALILAVLLLAASALPAMAVSIDQWELRDAGSDGVVGSKCNSANIWTATSGVMTKLSLTGNCTPATPPPYDFCRQPSDTGLDEVKEADNLEDTNGNGFLDVFETISKLQNIFAPGDSAAFYTLRVDDATDCAGDVQYRSVDFR